jgi:hypothetical protein
VDNPAVGKIAFHPQLVRGFHTVAAPLSDRLTLGDKPLKPWPSGTYAQNLTQLIATNAIEHL